MPIGTEAAPPHSGELHSPLADNFSLTCGGFFYRLQTRFDGDVKESVREGRRALWAVAVTWLPLLLLSLMQGLAYGDRVRVPFVRDFAVNARFLIALPVLILCEIGIDGRIRSSVQQFLESGLIRHADLSAFDAILLRLTRLRDRLLPEVVMLAIAYFPTLSPGTVEFMSNGVTSWHGTPVDSGWVQSYAGWWFLLVSAPIFRFLMIRWLWRMLLWALLLWRVSRLNLVLVPTHPDMSAGIGFLAHGQVRFGAIAFAGGVVMAGRFGNSLAYEGATVSSLKYIMVAYCVFAIAVLVVPLLLLMPKLMEVKRLGRHEYGMLASDYTHMFDSKWVHGRPPSGETLLGASDVQSLADMINSYAMVREMRVVPFDKKTLLALAFAAALPLAPVLILATPADQLIRTVLKLLA